MKKWFFNILNYILASLPLTLLPVINDVVRMFILAQSEGKKSGHVVSTILLATMVIFYTAWATKKLKIESAQSAIWLGVIWMMLTITAELFLGYFISGYTIAEIIYNYRIDQGKIGGLVLLSALLGPPLVFWIKVTPMPD